MRNLSCVFFLLLLPGFSTSLRAQHADIRILRCINHPVHQNLNGAMRFTSNSVTPLTIGVPVGLLAYEYFRENGNVRKPIVIGISVAATSLLDLGLKYSIKRTRPFVTYPDIIQRTDVGTRSFPSNHTGSSFALATSLSLEYPKWYVIAPSYAWAATVAYSRMRLGVHYPTDVLAGAAIGAGCAWLTWKINRYLQEK